MLNLFRTALQGRKTQEAFKMFLAEGIACRAVLETNNGKKPAPHMPHHETFHTLGLGN